MQTTFPKPKKESVIYEDNKLYACLASFSIVRGHTVIIWKDKVEDLHLLSRKDYEYLMDKIDIIRNALLKTLKLKKVYLLYMDEANQVHWHLIPRYNLKGYNIFKHNPAPVTNFSLAQKIKENIVL